VSVLFVVLILNNNFQLEGESMIVVGQSSSLVLVPSCLNSYRSLKMSYKPRTKSMGDGDF